MFTIEIEEPGVWKIGKLDERRAANFVNVNFPHLRFSMIFVRWGLEAFCRKTMFKSVSKEIQVYFYVIKIAKM